MAFFDLLITLKLWASQVVIIIIIIFLYTYSQDLHLLYVGNVSLAQISINWH